MKAVLLSLFLFLMTAVPSAEQSDWSRGMFALGNTAYENGKYDSAVACYQKLLNNGHEVAPVYYNLANACFRLNKLGYAILYYERAQKLAPNDEDIKANLRYARACIIDKIPEPEISFFSNALRNAHLFLSLRETIAATSALYALLCIIFIIGIFANYNGRLIAIYAGTVIGICLLVCGTSLAFKIDDHENVKHAVVIVPTVDAQNEPEGTQTLFTVHEGTKFLIRKRMDAWFLVSLPNGMAGWVPAKDLGEI